MPSPLPVFVLDTSVVVKWYVERQEPDLARARGLLDSFGQGRCLLTAPRLLAFELANVLITARRLPASDVREALAHLAQLDIIWKTFSWETLARAAEIAFKFDTAVYDAYFLAVAEEDGSTLITADEGFLRKAGTHMGIVPLRRVQLPPQV